MSAEQSTTTQDIVNTCQALVEAVESLHWISTSENAEACRTEAEECLKRVNGLVLGDGSVVYRLPSVGPRAVDGVEPLVLLASLDAGADAGRLLQVAQLDARVAGEQAADRLAEANPFERRTWDARTGDPCDRMAVVR
jgi:hypothetical protein